MLTPEAVVRAVEDRYDGLAVRETWGETALFYNPDGALPSGAYFLTVKTHDGANDHASALDREGVFRVSFALSPAAYRERFGDPPERPAKGEHVETGHEFTALDTLTPHPVYGWSNWVCVLSPSEATWTSLEPTVDEAYDLARSRFEKRVGSAA